jgi:hypothetical protein
MEDDALSRAKIITDQRAAAIFANSRLRRIVMVFATGELSLTEASERANIDLKRLHHHVVRLTGLGLLEVCGVRPRAGRPIKLYRASSEAFFIPEELFPHPFGQELTDELRECLAADATSQTRGLLLTVGPSGEPVGRVVKQRSSPGGAFEMWRILRLSNADLERLRGEIDAVLRRFESSSPGRSHVCLVHAAAARRKDESGPVDNPGSPRPAN